MENRKRAKVIHHKSAIPVYGAALVFLLWGLISPIYRLWAIALACITSAGAYLGLKLAFPGRDETVVEALLTGDHELVAHDFRRDGLARRRDAAELFLKLAVARARSRRGSAQASRGSS